MNFVTLNTNVRYHRLTKNWRVPRARRFFVAASLNLSRVGQNFVQVKHADRTRLQYAWTEFFAKQTKKSAQCLIYLIRRFGLWVFCRYRSTHMAAT